MGNPRSARGVLAALALAAALAVDGVRREEGGGRRRARAGGTDEPPRRTAARSRSTRTRGPARPRTCTSRRPCSRTSSAARSRSRRSPRSRSSRRWPTARSTPCSRTGSTSTSTRSTSRRPAPWSTGGPLGVEGHIGWFVPKYLIDEQPGVRDLGGPEGQGGPVQDGRVRRPGHVPRRRSLLRPEGQGADQGARPEPQARDRGRRARAGRPLDAALQAGEAGHLLLVHAAVPEPGVRPGRGRAAGAHARLQGRRQVGRRRRAVQVRIRRHGDREAVLARSSPTAARPPTTC